MRLPGPRSRNPDGSLVPAIHISTQLCNVTSTSCAIVYIIELLYGFLRTVEYSWHNTADVLCCCRLRSSVVTRHGETRKQRKSFGKYPLLVVEMPSHPIISLRELTN